jgi:hypothetical protein
LLRRSTAIVTPRSTSRITALALRMPDGIHALSGDGSVRLLGCQIDPLLFNHLGDRRNDSSDNSAGL